MNDKDKRTLQKLLIVTGVWIVATLAKIGIEHLRTEFHWSFAKERYLSIAILPNLVFHKLWASGSKKSGWQFQLSLELWVCSISFVWGVVD